MATDLSNTSTPITADGDYDFQTVPGNWYTIALSGTGTFTITLKNSLGKAYSNDAGDADLTITDASQVTQYDVRATGRTIRLTASSLAGASVDHLVTNLGVRA